MTEEQRDELLAQYTDLVNADVSADELEAFLAQHEDRELRELAETVRLLAGVVFPTGKISFEDHTEPDPSS